MTTNSGTYHPQRRFHAFVGVFLIAVSASAQQASRDLRMVSGRRVALVIGNERYPQSPLHSAVHDADAMSDALRADGFEVKEALNVGLKELESSIDWLVKKLTPEDTALVYYAGHGIQLDGENYLIPVDFAAKDEADAKYVSYSASRIQDRLQATGARLKILVFDACRTNPFRVSRGFQGGLAAMDSGRGTFIALATSPGHVAEEEAGNGGIFTQALVGAIRQPGLTLNEVFDKVRADVDSRTGGQQLPWTSSSVIGSFQFAAAPRAEKPDSDTSSGIDLYRLGQYTQALEFFNKQLAIDSKNALALRYRGDSELALGRTSKAIEDFTQAIAQQERPSEIYERRAVALMRANRTEEAILDLERAVKIDPTYGGAWDDLGMANDKLGKTKQALESYTYAIVLNDLDAKAHFRRGRIYANIGSYDDALRDFDAAAAVAPSAQLYIEKSLIHLKRSQFQDVILDCSHALELEPAQTWALNNRGLARMKLGQYDLAIADYTKSIAADPENSTAYRNRAFSYRVSKKPDLAAADMARALEIERETPSAAHKPVVEAAASKDAKALPQK